MNFFGVLDGIYGVKTGFTNNAGRCLVTACNRNGMDIICVVLGADTKDFRTTDSIKLIEYAFDNYKLVDLKNIVDLEFDNFLNDNINNFVIYKGVSQNISLSITDLSNNIYPIKKEELEFLTSNIAYSLEYNSPVSSSTYVGSIYISINNVLIDSCAIYFDCDIEKKTMTDYLYDFLSLPKSFRI